MKYKKDLEQIKRDIKKAFPPEYKCRVLKSVYPWKVWKDDQGNSFTKEELNNDDFDKDNSFALTVFIEIVSPGDPVNELETV